MDSRTRTIAGRVSRRALLFGAAASGSAVVLPQRAFSADGATQRYATDYISFVGSDGVSTVYLAHDNNRGQTGDRFFADHWICMWAEGEGWVPIKGSAHYENKERVLDRIPPSEHFRFRGSVADGLSFESQTNEMQFAMPGVMPVLSRRQSNGLFWVGSGPATLTWRGKRYAGRVILEHLSRNDWNRFTNSFEAIWKNFNALYLKTSDGGDFYIHSQDKAAPLPGKLVGFAAWGTPAPLTDIAFQITESVEADGGQFRWPTAWQIAFRHGGVNYEADVKTRIKRDWAWWKTGGFMMSVVDGTIAPSDGSTSPKPVTGWGELLI